MMRHLIFIVALCFVMLIAEAEVEIENIIASEAEVTGKMLFIGRCGSCHELPEASALKPAQWKAVLKKMQKRMDFLKVPPLTDEENIKIYSWLTR
ncbi:hypothetical protein MNBD_GAMMA25-110 [hydrothermal vent metagenome]|uniref:Cytochrome c domain-containing protein n=1 Tax=hydrothermal vent metagenome TaxID=652676 RepID=A0A3B1BRU4_9ZZZZ